MATQAEIEKTYEWIDNFRKTARVIMPISPAPFSTAIMETPSSRL